MDRQEPSILPDRRRAVVSAIRADPHESADRRVRHGGWSSGLSNVEPVVATGRVAEAYSLVCGALRVTLFATFAAQVCMTLAGFESGILGLGFVL